MKLIIESTKTNAGTRKLPMAEDVFRCFQAIIEDREKPRYKKCNAAFCLFCDRFNNPTGEMKLGKLRQIGAFDGQ